MACCRAVLLISMAVASAGVDDTGAASSQLLEGNKEEVAPATVSSSDPIMTTTSTSTTHISTDGGDANADPSQAAPGDTTVTSTATHTEKADQTTVTTTKTTTEGAVAAAPLLLEGSKEEAACKANPGISTKSSTGEEEPPGGSATPGQRVVMPADGLEYQLFLPKSWTSSGSETWPVVVFLHGHGDGHFAVMNSQSLPRLLSEDQSTSFDSRKCWCLDNKYAPVTAMKESEDKTAFVDEKVDLQSPLADCDFAEKFGAIVVMPQGWKDSKDSGWTEDRLGKVKALTRNVINTYRGDPKRVMLSGQSQGGTGAWDFAQKEPSLWASVNVICSSKDPTIAKELPGVNLWVVGNAHEGEESMDKLVEALKQRDTGETRYTRYQNAPAPPDPKFNHMEGHASYDLIYRDPRLWEWAFAKSNPEGEQAWS